MIITADLSVGWLWWMLAAAMAMWLFAEAKPLKHRNLVPQRLRKLVQVLYLRGFDGGELVVQSRNKPSPTVRVRKQIVGPNVVTLGGEARLDRNSPAKPKLLEQLGTEGIAYRLETGDLNMNDDLLHFEFGSNVDDVVRVIHVVFAAAGVKVDAECFLTLRRVTERTKARIGWTE